MYHISGWKEVGERENIITVFPSSTKKCIIDDDRVRWINGMLNLPSGATAQMKIRQTILSFNFVFVKGLGHSYPNGINHWMKGAEMHWEWLKQFSLP